MRVSIALAILLVIQGGLAVGQNGKPPNYEAELKALQTEYRQNMSAFQKTLQNASEEEWRKFWSRRPPPGSNDLMALIKRRVLKAEGDLWIFMANLRYFKDALAKLRSEGAAA